MKNLLALFTPDNFNTTPAQVEAVFAASMNKLWDYWGGYGYGRDNFINDDQYEEGILLLHTIMPVTCGMHIMERY